MQQFMQWPLAVAVSSAILLAGCLGGSGGSSSSGTTPPGGNAGGGAGTDTGGDPDPGGPDEDTRTFTAYSITLAAPQLVAPAREGASNMDRLVAAIAELIAPLAQAQSSPSPLPEDVRVALMGGDDNGTPDDPSDDRDQYLTAGEDYRVEQSEAGLVVHLPFEPRFDHYIEVATSGALSLSVPTYQTSLVADPVSTFITRMLAGRTAEFELLTIQEVDELLADIRRIAEDPAISTAITQAYASASSTQALIDTISSELYAVVDARLEERLTPPIGNEVLAMVDGEYYFQGFGIGAYDNDQSAGLVVRGSSREPSFTPAGNDQVRISVEAVDSSKYEAVHDIFGYVGVRVSVEDGPQEVTLDIDSRGITLPESLLDSAYDKTDTNAPRCQAVTADCRNQHYNAGQRLMTAGPASAPFNTLISNEYADHQVTDVNGLLELKVLNPLLEVGIKKPSTALTLNGEYGVLEISHLDINNSLQMEMTLSDVTFTGSQASYCQRTFKRLTKTMLPSFLVTYASESNDDCTTPDERLNYSANAAFGEQGALGLTQVLGSGSQVTMSGHASADGLTYLTYRQSPDVVTLTNSGQTRLQVPTGSRTAQFAVKRDSTTTTLANKRYRLMSTSVGAIQYMMEMNRYLTGTLEFDADGNAVMQTAVQTERVIADNTTQSQRNRAVNYSFSGDNLSYADGRLNMRSTVELDGVGFNTTLAGYVQEGGRLLLLTREAIGDNGYRLIGPMVGVCLNCE